MPLPSLNPLRGRCAARDTLCSNLGRRTSTSPAARLQHPGALSRGRLCRQAVNLGRRSRGEFFGDFGCDPSPQSRYPLRFTDACARFSQGDCVGFRLHCQDRGPSARLCPPVRLPADRYTLRSPGSSSTALSMS